MSFIAKVGINEGDDAYTVGANAAQDAMSQLGTTPNIVFVFSSIKYDQQQMLDGVRSVTKDTPLVGASTAGEITGAGPAKKNSVAVMAIASDSVHFHTAIGKGIKENAREAGREAARKVKEAASTDLAFYMMFADALAGNGSEVVRGGLDELGSHYPIVGGSAGDDARYKETYQYFNGEVFTNSVIGVGFAGAVEFSFGVNHGWIPVGIPVKITKSEGAVLHEVDGKPAITLYEDYLGAEAAAELKEKTLAEIALSYPLGIKQEGNEEMLLRAPFFVNKDGSIVCGGEVPQGAEIRLMVGSKEDAVLAAKHAAEHAQKELGGQAQAVFIFSCHVRDKLYANKDKAKEEIDAILSEVGTDTPLIGFYTYAEQAPIGGESRNVEKCNPALHNETVVVCLIREK